VSNALAIATVTTALAQIVRTAVQSVVPGSDVLTERPDASPVNQPRARLFLYQVSPNAALRSADLPTRAANGTVTTRPTAAIDLHYLLAFYGNEGDLEPQRMLGAVVRDIHAKPVLMRQLILDAVASEPFLNGSNLADAPEQVKFTPLSLTLEEMSKVWSVFFQAPYALSVAYQGTVLLIESDENAVAALPVLRRGPEDQGVATEVGPFPALSAIHIAAPDDAARRPPPPSFPSAQLGTVLILSGRDLGGDVVNVRFDHTRLNFTNTITVPPTDRSATEIRLTLVDDAAAQTAWAPGLFTISVVVQRGSTERTTNELPLQLAARVTALAPPNPIPRDGSGDVTLTVTCTPQVRAAQRAVVVVADREVMADPHAVSTGTLTFVLRDAPVVAGAIVRLRIDGVDSLPFKRQALPPPPRFVFDDAQKVTIT
jgi:uncharacterized protein DUF4255